MKKLLLILFTIILLTTIILTLVFAVKAYKFEMDPANGIDILEGMAEVNPIQFTKNKKHDKEQEEEITFSCFLIELYCKKSTNLQQVVDILQNM